MLYRLCWPSKWMRSVILKDCVCFFTSRGLLLHDPHSYSRATQWSFRTPLKKCKTLPLKLQCDELTQPDIKHSVWDSIRMFCKTWSVFWMAMFCLLAALQRSELSWISIGKNLQPPPACRWHQTRISNTCCRKFLYVCAVRVKWGWFRSEKQ